MSLPTLLKALEDLVFEMAVWVLLVPKTLLHVIRRPGSLSSLADASADEKDDRVHDEYVSLVLLWLIVGVLPGIPLITSEQGPQWIANALLGRLSVEASIVAAAALLLLGPLAFATGHCFMVGSRLSRGTLRRPFAIQCGCFAPFLLAYFISLTAHMLTVLSRYERLFSVVQFVAIIAGLVWFFCAEYIVLRVETGGHGGRAVAALGLGLLFWAGFMALSRVILTMVAVYYA